MKQISIALLTLFATLSVQAQSFLPVGIIVEDFNTTTMIQPDCDFCTGGPLVTKTTITFSQEWCANVTSDAYEIVVAERSTFGMDNYKTVRVQLKEQMADCMGPAYKRTFVLTTDQIGQEDRVILLNSSAAQ